MADAKLGILISADPNQALAGLDKLNGGLDKTNDQIKILDGQFQRLQKIASMPGLSFAQQQRLNTMLAGTKSELDKAKRSFDLASPSIQKFQSTSSAATQSTMNFGRVIQDLPYGFMGVANNLNPLLESFQRLRATTGSTGSAFSALGKSLTGAGGIGLALSVASSLAVLFGDSLFGVSKAAKEADEANKKLAQDISGDFVKLASLVGVATNLNASYDERAKALKALNQEYKPYLQDLGIEEVTAKNVAESYDKITKSLVRQAVVKGLQGEIAKAVEDTAKQLIALEKTEQKRKQEQDNANQKLKVQKSNVDAATEAYQRFNKVQADGVIAQQRARAEAQSGFGTFNNFEAIQKRIYDQLKQQLSPLMQLTENFEDLNITLDKVSSPKADKATETIIQKAKRILSQFGDGTIRLTVLPVFNELDTKEESLKKAKQIIGDVNSFFSDFTSKDRKLNIAIPFSFEETIAPPEDKDTARKFAFEFGDMFKTELDNYFKKPVKIDVTIDAAVKLEERQKNIGALFGIKFDPKDNPFTDIEKRAIVAAKTIQDIMVPAFQGLFDAILDGESPIKSFFQSLGQAVGQLIQKLISAAVTAAILSAVFPGGFGGVKGFGAIFGNLLGFAEGGRPPTDKPSVVGETGREIFVPDRPGVIIPNRVTEKILSGGLFGKIFGGGRKKGGSVFPGFFYETGEEGREMYFPFSSKNTGFKMPNLYNLFKSSPSIQIKPLFSLSGLGTSNQSVLQPAFSTETQDQYIPMLKNGELGLLIKRGQKHIRNNS